MCNYYSSHWHASPLAYRASMVWEIQLYVAAEFSARQLAGHFLRHLTAMHAETGSWSQNDLWPCSLLWESRALGARPTLHQATLSHPVVFLWATFETLFFFCLVLWLELELIFKQSFHFSLVSARPLSARPLLWTWPTMGRAARQHSWFRKVQGHRGRWGQDSPHSLNCREIYTSYWAMELPTSLTPSACIPHHPHCLSTQASMHLHSGSW